MCMVLFAWLVMQEYFKEMTDQDIRRRIYDEQRNQIEQDMGLLGLSTMVWVTIPSLMLTATCGNMEISKKKSVICGTTNGYWGSVQSGTPSFQRKGM